MGYCINQNFTGSDISCYTYMSTPVLLVFIEIICVYCSIKTYATIKTFYRSFLLTILYITLHISLILRIVYSAGKLLNFGQTFFMTCDLLIIFSKDILYLSFSARLFEVMAEMLTRYSRWYIFWKQLSWLIIFLHIIGLIGIHFLRIFMKWKTETIYYEISVLGVISASILISTLIYRGAFEKASPDAYDVMKISLWIMMILLWIAVFIRIGFQFYFFDKLYIPIKNTRVEDIYIAVLIGGSEILPFLAILAHIFRERRSKQLNIVAISSFTSIEEILNQPEQSERSSFMK